MPELLADELFAASAQLCRLEEQLTKSVLGLLGIVTDFWPFEDITSDAYDRSLELQGAVPGLRFTPEQIQTIWSWGFCCAWICYHSGPELECYYSRACGEVGVPTLRQVEFSPAEQP